MKLDMLKSASAYAYASEARFAIPRGRPVSVTTVQAPRSAHAAPYGQQGPEPERWSLLFPINLRAPRRPGERVHRNKAYNSTIQHRQQVNQR